MGLEGGELVPRGPGDRLDRVADGRRRERPPAVRARIEDPDRVPRLAEIPDPRHPSDEKGDSGPSPCEVRPRDVERLDIPAGEGDDPEFPSEVHLADERDAPA